MSFNTFIKCHDVAIQGFHESGFRSLAIDALRALDRDDTAAVLQVSDEAMSRDICLQWRRKLARVHQELLEDIPFAERKAA